MRFTGEKSPQYRRWRSKGAHVKAQTGKADGHDQIHSGRPLLRNATQYRPIIVGHVA